MTQLVAVEGIEIGDHSVVNIGHLPSRSLNY